MQRTAIHLFQTDFCSNIEAYLEPPLVFAYPLPNAFYNISMFKVNSEQSHKSERKWKQLRSSSLLILTYLNILMNLTTTIKLNFFPVDSSDFSHTWPSTTWLGNSSVIIIFSCKYMMSYLLFLLINICNDNHGCYCSCKGKNDNKEVHDIMPGGSAEENLWGQSNDAEKNLEKCC